MSRITVELTDQERRDLTTVLQSAVRRCESELTATNLTENARWNIARRKTRYESLLQQVRRRPA